MMHGGNSGVREGYECVLKKIDTQDSVKWRRLICQLSLLNFFNYKLGHSFIKCSPRCMYSNISSGCLFGLVGSALDHRSLPPEFESWCGHI